jgi:hypothetical protein
MSSPPFEEDAGNLGPGLELVKRQTLTLQDIGQVAASKPQITGDEPG